MVRKVITTFILISLFLSTSGCGRILGDLSLNSEPASPSAEATQPLATPHSLATNTSLPVQDQLTPTLTEQPTSSTRDQLTLTPTAASQTVLQGESPRFGIIAVIPNSSGNVADPASVQAIAKSDSRYMRVAFEWSISEPEQGVLSFDTQNDAIIKRIESNGLRIIPTLYVGSGWMNGNPGGRAAGGSRSYPPDDLSSNWSDDTGYSPGYYEWVYQFISHYRGHFDYVAIENEANSQLFWGGSADEYVRLLKTAYLAVKQADPAVVVMDSGFVSSGLGLCIVGDLLQTDRLPGVNPYEFAQLYYSAESDQIQINSPADLDTALSLGRVKEQCERITHMLDNMGGSIDAINFHFYEDHHSLPVVVDWLRAYTADAGYFPRVVSNEFGARGFDLAYARSPEHGAFIFKKLISGVGLGMELILWYSADSVERGRDKVGIFEANGTIRSAGETFQLVTQTLEGNYSLYQVVSTGPNLYHYQFADSSGAPTLEAIWIEAGAQSLSLSAPVGASSAEIVDSNGQAQTISVAEGKIDLLLGTAPVLVFWK